MVMTKAEEEEPLLRENPRRFVLFPIKDTEVRKYCFYTIYMHLTLRIKHSSPVLHRIRASCADVEHVQKG